MERFDKPHSDESTTDYQQLMDEAKQEVEQETKTPIMARLRAAVSRKGEVSDFNRKGRRKPEGKVAEGAAYAMYDMMGHASDMDELAADTEEKAMHHKGIAERNLQADARYFRKEAGAIRRGTEKIGDDMVKRYKKDPDIADEIVDRMVDGVEKK